MFYMTHGYDVMLQQVSHNIDVPTYHRCHTRHRRRFYSNICLYSCFSMSDQQFFGLSFGRSFQMSYQLSLQIVIMSMFLFPLSLREMLLVGLARNVHLFYLFVHTHIIIQLNQNYHSLLYNSLFYILMKQLREHLLQL